MLATINPTGYLSRFVLNCELKYNLCITIMVSRKLQSQYMQKQRIVFIDQNYRIVSIPFTIGEFESVYTKVMRKRIPISACGARRNNAMKLQKNLLNYLKINIMMK